MGKKLFVGGLPYGLVDEDLRAAFSAVGTVVTATVIIDRAMNRSKGFGFVEMSTEAEAQAAIDKMNGTMLKDQTGKERNIIVSEAKPQVPREGGFNSRGGF